jgi:general secretion pathway protein G
MLSRPSRPSRAFTLIEMLLVIVIIGILAGSIAIGLSGRSEQARITRASSDLKSNLALALDLFEQDTGRYPSGADGLDALVEAPAGVDNWRGPYLRGGLKPDPWGNAYEYQENNGGYTIRSAGPDGQSGNKDDITATSH